MQLVHNGKLKSIRAACEPNKTWTIINLTKSKTIIFFSVSVVLECHSIQLNVHLEKLNKTTWTF